MYPLAPAPFLPDLGEVFRKATEEGFKQGLAWVRMDEGKQCSIRCSFSTGLVPTVGFDRRSSREDQAQT